MDNGKWSGWVDVRRLAYWVSKPGFRWKVDMRVMQLSRNWGIALIRRRLKTKADQADNKFYTERFHGRQEGSANADQRDVPS